MVERRRPSAERGVGAAVLKPRLEVASETSPEPEEVHRSSDRRTPTLAPRRLRPNRLAALGTARLRTFAADHLPTVTTPSKPNRSLPARRLFCSPPSAPSHLSRRPSLALLPHPWSQTPALLGWPTIFNGGSRKGVRRESGGLPSSKAQVSSQSGPGVGQRPIDFLASTDGDQHIEVKTHATTVDPSPRAIPMGEQHSGRVGRVPDRVIASRRMR